MDMFKNVTVVLFGMLSSLSWKPFLDTTESSGALTKLSGFDGSISDGSLEKLTGALSTALECHQPILFLYATAEMEKRSEDKLLLVVHEACK